MSEKKIIKNYLETQCLKIIPDEATLDKIINIRNIFPENVSGNADSLNSFINNSYNTVK